MIKQFLKDENGQDIVEYSLLLVLIGAVAILILTGMGTSVQNVFARIKQALDTANQASTGTGATS